MDKKLTKTKWCDLGICGAGSRDRPGAPWWIILEKIVQEYTNRKDGIYDLIINQNDMEDRVSEETKEIFKKEVLPTIIEIARIDSLTGEINVVLYHGHLHKAYLKFQCEEEHTF